MLPADEKFLTLSYPPKHSGISDDTSKIHIQEGRGVLYPAGRSRKAIHPQEGVKCLLLHHQMVFQPTSRLTNIDASKFTSSYSIETG